jgi:hypothetical protein
LGTPCPGNGPALNSTAFRQVMPTGPSPRQP